MNSFAHGSSPLHPFNRRQFLAATGAAAVVLPRTTWAGRAPASERITVGVIGWGMMGPANTKAFLEQSDCQVVAACDLDPQHLQQALDTINEQYGNKDCKSYHDYRELLARDDIDAVMIAVPDHWHAIIATEAASRKKDIYCEKPLARTIAEQQAIVRAVEKNNIIWQTGSWQRSVASFRKAAEIVRNGLIGTVTHVEVGLPEGHHDFHGNAAELVQRVASAALPDVINSAADIVPGTKAWDLSISEPPAGFDFNTWIGPSKMEPFMELRVHQNWRWNYNTGAGQLMDWIGHHGDIAHWGLGFDTSRAVGSGRVRRFSACPRRLEHRDAIHGQLRVPQGSDALSSGRENDHRGRQPRHPDGNQVDRHRWLGVGRSRRLRRVQPGMAQMEIGA